LLTTGKRLGDRFNLSALSEAKLSYSSNRTFCVTAEDVTQYNPFVIRFYCLAVIWPPTVTQSFARCGFCQFANQSAGAGAIGSSDRQLAKLIHPVNHLWQKAE